MPKKIVLVEPKYGMYEFTYIPQGLLLIAAILEEHGHEVSVYDTSPDISCDILGISATLPQYDRVLSIAMKSDAQNVIVGGSIATTTPVETVSSSLINYAVVGDGEGPMLDFANGVNVREIPGAVYKRDGAVVINPNLDFKYTFRGRRYPIPAYHLWRGELGECINITRNREYSWSWRWVGRNRPKYWEDFEREVGVLIDLGVKSVSVTDEHFGNWHNNISSTIRALDCFDSWSCKATTDVVLERELDKKLRGSNCSMLELDVKTASPRLLYEMGTVKLEDHELAMELLEYAGIKVRIHVTLGWPGETVSSMTETWEWLTGKNVRISTFVPMPGTVYYECHQDYNHFGLDIIGTNRCDFVIDDSKPVYYLPWKSNTIDQEKFLLLRNRIVEEVYGK